MHFLWRWVVSLNGEHPGSLVTTVSGHHCLAHLKCRSLEGFYCIVHFCSDHIVSFEDGNTLCGLDWYQDLFTRDGRKLHQYFYLDEWGSGCDRIRRDSQCFTCSFLIEDGQGIGCHTFSGDMLSEPVGSEHRWVSGILF